MMHNESGWLVNSSGHKTWYSDVGPDGKVPILLLHGGPGAPHDTFEPLAAELSKERRVVMYDQLGCGLSDKPQDSSLWTIQYYLQELRWVIRELGLNEVVILGQSWGGMLALEYAVTRPQGLRGLVLSNSLASSRTWNSEARRLVDEMPVHQREIIDRAESDGDTSSPEYQEAAMEFYRRHVCRIPEWPECLNRMFAKFTAHLEVYRHMWGASEFYCTGTLRDWDIRPRLKDVPTPTLIISGEFDEATPAVERELQAGIGGSRWELVRDASHMTHLEKPRQYLKAATGLLDGIDGQQPVR
jgi:proline-specific peptidase